MTQPLILTTGNGVKFKINEEDKDLGELTWTAYRHRRGGRCYTYIGRRKYPGGNAPKLHIHRIIMARMLGNSGTLMLDPRSICDHINGDTTDNRRENLRFAGYSHNRQNSRLDVRNTSGYRGVHWNTERKQWVARLRLNNRDIFLGYFDEAKQAAAAYDAAARCETVGTFVRLNFPEGKTLNG